MRQFDHIASFALENLFDTYPDFVIRNLATLISEIEAESKTIDALKSAVEHIARLSKLCPITEQYKKEKKKDIDYKDKTSRERFVKWIENKKSQFHFTEDSDRAWEYWSEKLTADTNLKDSDINLFNGFLSNLDRNRTQTLMRQGFHTTSSETLAEIEAWMQSHKGHVHSLIDDLNKIVTALTHPTTLETLKKSLDAVVNKVDKKESHLEKDAKKYLPQNHQLLKEPKDLANFWQKDVIYKFFEDLLKKGWAKTA